MEYDYNIAEMYITKELHNEFAKRVEEENTRQNHRIGDLEIAVRQINSIATSVERLATNMEHMAEEQIRQSNTLAEQNDRLKELESTDGKKWRSLIEKIVTAIISLIIGFLSAKFGLS